MSRKEHTDIKVIKYMLNIAAKEKPGIFFAYFLLFITNFLDKIQAIVIPKFLFDELYLLLTEAQAELHIKNAVLSIISILVCNMISRILGTFAVRIRDTDREFFNESIEQRLSEKVMKIDYELTEDPVALDQMKKAEDGGGWYSGNVCGILDSFFEIITNIILIFGIITILAIKCPLAIPVEAIALFFISRIDKKINEINIKSFNGLSKSNRIFSYLFFELSDYRFGKDIRLYNSTGLFNRKASEYLQQKQDIWNNQAKQILRQSYKSVFVEQFQIVILVFYAAYKALKKKLSVGDFSMCVNAFSELKNLCRGVEYNILDISKKANYAYEYIKFMDYPDALVKGNRKIDPSKNHDIEFKNVSFKYPRTENYILKNINLKIPHGQHIALVGLNGAGKTTLIKLLCRMYDVTEGEILVDGINIKEYSDEEYRKLISPVFQDFQLFAFTLKENIAFSSDIKDEELEGVIKQSGLYEDVQKLPYKYDTYIEKRFSSEGVELSGGQRQKVALARALYKKSPIVILDEPTAALDPVAEAEIYSQFNLFVDGKTAVYISHRLSSCKFCEKIAVFSDQKLIEYGSHDELIKKNGLYAEMFNTQAKQYLSEQNKEIE